jgi:hypothetical protein
MKWLLVIGLSFISITHFAQSDSADVITLSRETVLSEVVIRSDLDVVGFLYRVKYDTSFYKAFRNLRVLQFSSINDIRMLNRKQKVIASLYSKTRQIRSNGCRSMEILEERTLGDIRKGSEMNYYTAGLYASLFFTETPVCGENNIVAGMERKVKESRGIEKHKEQLKMLFFNPGKRIPGIPFIGDKIDIFDPEVASYYNFSIDMEEWNGQPCYVFSIKPRPDLSAGQRDRIVFDNITTWFHSETLEIVGRNYDLSYDTPFYDFKVNMEVKMQRFGELLVPQVLTYNGNWKVATKKRERGIFTALLYDFSR